MPVTDKAGMALLLQALENFHFDRLNLTLHGRVDEQMQVSLHLEGRNPDLYGGHAFELNVNLEGALALLAGQAVDTWRVPDLLARKILDVVR
ncbi:MAG: YdbH domain-containing protein [Geminicoccaceae bacterium]